MTIHHPPTPPATPLHRWRSGEIDTFIRSAVNRPTLPAPGHNARRLIQESTRPMLPTTDDTATDWTGTTMCNHRRDAAMPAGQPGIDVQDLEPNHRRILRILAALDTRRQPDGTPLRMCVNRRRLKASAETMQDLHRAGLVNGAGSRDPFGTGNTPDSSWWWLSTAGMAMARRIGPGEARDV
jgi:hypothetical protein